MTAADTPSRDDYQPRTPERLIEILRAQSEQPRSWQREAATTIERLLIGFAAKPAVREVTDAMIEAYAKSCGEASIVKNSFLWHEIRQGLIAALSTKAPTP